ncbi:hypothetical protein D3C76_1479720 [compost metagenome]
MLESYRIGSTGCFKSGDFWCPFIDIAFGRLNDLFGVYIHPDIRFGSKRGLKITIMTMAHASR